MCVLKEPNIKTQRIVKFIQSKNFRIHNPWWTICLEIFLKTIFHTLLYCTVKHQREQKSNRRKKNEKETSKEFANDKE